VQQNSEIVSYWLVECARKQGNSEQTRAKIKLSVLHLLATHLAAQQVNSSIKYPRRGATKHQELKNLATKIFRMIRTLLGSTAKYDFSFGTESRNL
jgi:hypothetical protein